MISSSLGVIRHWNQKNTKSVSCPHHLRKYERDQREKWEENIDIAHNKRGEAIFLLAMIYISLTICLWRQRFYISESLCEELQKNFFFEQRCDLGILSWRNMNHRLNQDTTQNNNFLLPRDVLVGSRSSYRNEIWNESFERETTVGN